MNDQEVYEWALNQSPEQYWDDAYPLIELAMEHFDLGEEYLEELDSIIRLAINSAQMP